MRSISSTGLRGLLVVATAVMSLLPAWADVAVGDSGCPDPADPQLAPALSGLYETIGPVMGQPAECAQVDANGNTIQVTTTGLAIYRPDGTSIFASGEQHWSLSGQNLQTWTGNWHNGLYPPATATASDVSASAVDPRVGSVRAMTVLQPPQDQPNTALLEDFRGSRFAVQIDAGCPDLKQSIGQEVFMRSDLPGTDLILLQQRESCAVTSMRAANAD